MHHAVATKNQAVVPSLLSLANAWQAIGQSVPGPDHADRLTSEQFDQRDAMGAVLDALIQMQADVPASTLHNLAAVFPNYAAILLSRLPQGESQSLSLEFYRPEPKTLSAQNLQYAMLSISPDDVGWEIELRNSIESKSEQQFYRDLMRFIAAQLDDYRVTAEALVAKNLMTVSEQEQSLPMIDLDFVDQRGADYSPIAEPPSLPSDVTGPERH